MRTWKKEIDMYLRIQFFITGYARYSMGIAIWGKPEEGLLILEATQVIPLLVFYEIIILQ
jgi:hypothetical protein